MSNTLTLWVIYRNPTDYPGKWVLRGHDLGGPAPRIVGIEGGQLTTMAGHWARQDCVVGDSLEEVRAAVPLGMVRLMPDGHDDPTIVEVWI